MYKNVQDLISSTFTRQLSFKRKTRCPSEFFAAPSFIRVLSPDSNITDSKLYIRQFNKRHVLMTHHARHSNDNKIGPAISQAVSHQLLKPQARVHSCVIPCRFCDSQVALGQFSFLRALKFSPVNITPQLLHIS
jgi:hypothetical protein